jgi:hypothetical protein
MMTLEERRRQWRESQRRVRARWKATGKCVHCGQPRLEGSWAFCEQHLLLNRVKVARYRAKRRADAACVALRDGLARGLGVQS